MHLSTTFSLYVGRQFLVWLGGTLLVLMALVLLIDTVELLRRASTKDGVGFDAVVGMALLKLPDMTQKIMPFAAMFAGILAFWRLNRSHELVAARAAGVSAWQFLLPALLLTLLVGAIKTAILGPVSSALMLQYERLEARHLSGRPSFVELSSTGLWLREPVNGGHAVIHARHLRQENMSFDHVMVLRFKGQDRFISRIDAPRARLLPGAWEMEDASITDVNGAVQKAPRYRLATNLTPESIHDSFASPESISFWALPEFIEILERAGFSGLRHRLHWHSQLASPFLLCAMVLIAAAFTLRPTRQRGVGMMMAAGAGIAFIIFFASDVIFALGLTDRLPLILAAWTPAIISLSAGLALVFHLEDG